jgi:hypothetical protein
MVLDYAKTRSDATVLNEGGPDELEFHKRRRLAEKGTFRIILESFSVVTVTLPYPDSIIFFRRTQASP